MANLLLLAVFTTLVGEIEKVLGLTDAAENERRKRQWRQYECDRNASPDGERG